MQFQMPTIEQVDPVISPNDDMNAGDASQWYINTGKIALEHIIKALDNPYSLEHTVNQILDLPSGYGRVLRWLKACFPESSITACDTNVDAVNFSSKQFGATGVISDYDITNIRFQIKSYDLIFCGSLLTHFDAIRCNQLLNLFIENLNEKGVLVFTTHGRIAAHFLPQQHSSLYGLELDVAKHIISEYESNGFGYANYDDKYPVYGISISSPAWVMRQIERFPNIRICYMIEGGWGHQDVYGLVKI